MYSYYTLRCKLKKKKKKKCWLHIIILSKRVEPGKGLAVARALLKMSCFRLFLRSTYQLDQK